MSAFIDIKPMRLGFYMFVDDTYSKQIYCLLVLQSSSVVVVANEKLKEENQRGMYIVLNRLYSINNTFGEISLWMSQIYVFVCCMCI